MKTLPEYSRYLQAEKKAYQQISQNSQRLLASKDLISEMNQSIVAPLADIEELKQDLASANLETEEARSQLANVRDMMEEQLRMKKEETKDLQIYTLNEESFKEYLGALARMKDLENKLKGMHF